MNEIFFDTYANNGSSAGKGTGGIDLKGMKIPDIVETLKYDDVLTGMFKRLVILMPELATITASDPVYKILEVCAYRETLLRARVNNSVKAMLLVSAKKSDLDNIAANFNIKRQIKKAGDPNAHPPVPPLMETDEQLRRRVQLSFDGFTTAGSEASYLFHTLNADDRIKDAFVRTGLDKNGKVEAGVVEIFILPTDVNDVKGMVDKVKKYVGADIRRPLTDEVKIGFVKPQPVVGGIEAKLHLFSGVTQDGVVDRAKANLLDYVKTTQKIGHDLAISGIYKALHIAGVESVELIKPTADISVDRTHVAVVDPKTINITIAP